MGVPRGHEAQRKPFLCRGKYTTKVAICTVNHPQTLQLTRRILDESNYSQIPQLSSGLDIDLDHMALVL